MVQAATVLSLTNFRSHLLLLPSSFILSPSFILTIHVQASWLVLETCPISIFLKSSGSSCKAENHCSGIISTLMQLES